jgi:cholesterol transport system auxiliary component
MRCSRTKGPAYGLLLAALSGCALTSKATAIEPRYFSPDLAAPAPRAAPPETAPLELRLGMIEAASHLEERMAYRVNASELGYRDDRRWSERPEEYVRRALEGELFERLHVRRVLSGAATTLDVELTAFEEVRDPAPHVRVALIFRLHDDRQVSLERSLVVERPLVEDGDVDHAQRVASALGAALAQAVAEVGAEVLAQLRAQPAAKPVTAAEGSGATQ